MRPASERSRAERPDRPERDRHDFADEIDIVLPISGVPQLLAPRDDRIGILASIAVDRDAAVDVTHRLFLGFARQAVPEEVVASNRIRTVSRRMRLSDLEIADELSWRIGKPERDGDFARVPVRIFRGRSPDERAVVGDVFVNADSLVDDLQIDLRDLTEE